MHTNFFSIFFTNCFSFPFFCFPEVKIGWCAGHAKRIYTWNFPLFNLSGRAYIVFLSTMMAALYKKLLFCSLFSGISFFCGAQTSWKLRSTKDSIKIYSAQVPGSRINAIKVETSFPASLSQMVAVILDINTSIQWVYSTKSCTLLRQVSPSELYYYSEIDFPWPASNRDFVANIKVTQDPHTKIVTVEASNLSEKVPVKPGIVRVTQFTGKWTITPESAGHIHVEYALQVDPGGSIPAWLINLFSTRGPYESFKKLRHQLQSPAYRGAAFAFIAD